jgi:hypothetical protein
MYIKGYSVVAKGITSFYGYHTDPPLLYLIGQRRMRREVPLERQCVLSELEHRAIMARPLQKFFDQPQAACWFLKATKAGALRDYKLDDGFYTQPRLQHLGAHTLLGHRS